MWLLPLPSFPFNLQTSSCQWELQNHQTSSVRLFWYLSFPLIGFSPKGWIRVIPSVHVPPVIIAGWLPGRLHNMVQIPDGIKSHVGSTEGLIISIHLNKDSLKYFFQHLFERQETAWRWHRVKRSWWQHSSFPLTFQEINSCPQTCLPPTAKVKPSREMGPSCEGHLVII